MKSMVTQSMRPKWKTDTYYIPLSEGIYLRGNSQHLLLKGHSLYRLLEHLVPNLDGTVTVEEITEGLDGERKQMIIRLLEKLHTHHFLTDTSEDQPYELHPSERATHAANL